MPKVEFAWNPVIKNWHLNDQPFQFHSQVKFPIINATVTIDTTLTISNLSKFKKFIQNLIETETISFKADTDADKFLAMIQKQLTQIFQHQTPRHNQIGLKRVGDPEIKFKVGSKTAPDPAKPELIEPKEQKALEKAVKAIHHNPDRLVINQFQPGWLADGMLVVQTPLKITNQTKFVQLLMAHYQDLHLKNYINESQNDLVEGIEIEFNDFLLHKTLADPNSTGFDLIDHQYQDHLKIIPY